MDNRKMNSDLKRRCIEARITKLESALIRKVRTLQYGQTTLIIHNIEGQPIRIEVSSNSSEILNAKDGLELEDSTYVDNLND
jgi:hypothetical protein